MPLTKKHIFVGAVAGSACYITDRRINSAPVDPEALADAFLLGALAGSLPDILEPPLNKKHRRFFHSFVTLAAAGAACPGINSIKNMDDEEKAVLRGMLVAYISHLLMDSRTPAGLPVVF